MHTYSILDYGSMIADNVRTNAYCAALRQSIKRGDVVLDIGAGTGFFSLLACMYGARRVYAIEPNNAIHVAKSVAAASGLDGRIEFIQDFSAKTHLPERADVIVSDLRGVLPLHEQHIPILRDARQRFLASNGILIPQQDTLHVAVVSAPDQYRRYLTPWGNNDYGFNMQAMSRLTVNTWGKETLTPEQIILAPQIWATLDYRTITEPNVSGKAVWQVEREGVAHGLALWFDATLTPGVQFSNAPGAPEAIYGIAFFPWEQPVALAPGDTVSVKLRANLVGEIYYWSWYTAVTTHDNTAPAKACFNQSDFLGLPLSIKRLRKKVSNYIPALSTDGQIQRFILAQMDGTKTIEEITKAVMIQFPDRFPNWREALAHIGSLSEWYSL